MISNIKTGRVALDVNEVHATSQQEAEQIGRSRQQDAIYNLATHETFDLRHSGSAAKSVHAHEDDGPGDRRGTARNGRADDSEDEGDYQSLTAGILKALKAFDESRHPLGVY